MNYKNDEETKAKKAEQISLFDKIKVIMNRNPGAIKNAQMKWIMNLNKHFNNKGFLSTRQFQILKDISVQIAYNERVR